MLRVDDDGEAEEDHYDGLDLVIHSKNRTASPERSNRGRYFGANLDNNGYTSSDKTVRQLRTREEVNPENCEGLKRKPRRDKTGQNGDIEPLGKENEPISDDRMELWKKTFVMDLGLRIGPFWAKVK